MNKYTAEVPLYIFKDKYTLLYDWDAIAELKTVFSDNQIDEIVEGRNVEGLAKMVKIGLKRHHPDFKEADLIEKSPPLVPIITAVSKALSLAYFGVNSPSEYQEQGTQKKQSEEGDKIVDAMRYAYRVGLSNSEFFSLTPWQFRLKIEAYQENQKQKHDHDAWMMWHNALLSGGSGKNFPKLEQFLSDRDKNRVKNGDPRGMIDMLRAHNKRVTNGSDC